MNSSENYISQPLVSYRQALSGPVEAVCLTKNVVFAPSGPAAHCSTGTPADVTSAYTIWYTPFPVSKYTKLYTCRSKLFIVLHPVSISTCVMMYPKSSVLHNFSSFCKTSIEFQLWHSIRERHQNHIWRLFYHCFLKHCIGGWWSQIVQLNERHLLCETPSCTSPRAHTRRTLYSVLDESPVEATWHRESTEDS